MGMIQSALNKLFITSLGAAAGVQKSVEDYKEAKGKTPKSDETVETERGEPDEVPEAEVEAQTEATEEPTESGDAVTRVGTRTDEVRGTSNAVQDRVSMLEAIQNAQNPDELAPMSRQWYELAKALQGKRKSFVPKENGGIENGKE